MKIYAAHTYGQVGTWHEDEQPELEGAKAGDPIYGDIVISRHTTGSGAQDVCEKAFLNEPPPRAERGQDPWRKDVLVWAPPHDEQRTDAGHMQLWSLMPAAAPSMNDPYRAFYPQMRTTSFWVESIDVVEDEPVVISEALEPLREKLRESGNEPGPKGS